MKLPVKKKHSKKTSRLPLFLLLAVVVTMLSTTGTLAKYSSQFSGTMTAEIAAFAGGGSMDFTLELEDMCPGDREITYFTVRNYEGDQNCDVAMEYEIQVETTGNLPLTFALVGTEEEGAGAGAPAGGLTPAGGDSEESGAAGGITYLATGGKLPVAGGESGVQVQHKYELQITWPEDRNDAAYSTEVDQIIVTVTAVQARPTDGEGI